jgi:hypothetical protein
MAEGIKAEVEKRAREGRISCKEALKLANELGVSPAEVGRAADELKIKIAGCQLGCFK